MKAKDYITRLLPKIAQYKLSRSGILKPGSPITLTYSVTAACQSKCKTCHIGSRYQKNPEIRQRDLNLDEVGRIFESMGQIYFFNVSGGEPYLRDDLPQVVKLACRYLKPRMFHIPTNALASERIRDLTEHCLEILEEYDLNVPLTVKPSIDGVGSGHDEIRGIKGNFRQLGKTINYLKEIEKRHSNLHLELGTVISNFNIHQLSEIEDYVHSLGVQSYRNEIAEQRAEFFNLGDPITPDSETYERLMVEFAAKIRANLIKKRDLAIITEAFRLVYYDLVVKILKEKRQVIPCYAGISNVHINYDGEVWPCCVLGYCKPMGFLREEGYDFQKVWHSEKADKVRKYIKDGNCACPLANQGYSNILSSPAYLGKTVRNLISFYRQ